MGMGVAAQAGDTLATVTACSWTPNTEKNSNGSTENTDEWVLKNYHLFGISILGAI